MSSTKTEMYITVIETNENGGIHQNVVPFDEFFSKAYSAVTIQRVFTNHDFKANFGRPIRAVADNGAFTILLPKFVEGKIVEGKFVKGTPLKGISIWLDPLDESITIRSIDGCKVDGSEELIFSKGKEKASFEYNTSTKSWDLW